MMIMKKLRRLIGIPKCEETTTRNHKAVEMYLGKCGFTRIDTSISINDNVSRDARNALKIIKRDYSDYWRYK